MLKMSFSFIVMIILEKFPLSGLCISFSKDVGLEFCALALSFKQLKTLLCQALGKNNISRFWANTISLMYNGDLITIPLNYQNWKYHFCLNTLIYFSITNLKNKSSSEHILRTNVNSLKQSLYCVRKIMAKFPNKLSMIESHYRKNFLESEVSDS